MLTLFDIGVSGSSMLDAITGSGYGITHYLSFCTRQKRNSKGYTHIFEVHQHGRTIVWTLSDIGGNRVSDKSKMAAITGGTYVPHIHISHTTTVQFIDLDNKGI